MSKKKKVLRGFSNIHFAPYVDGEYQTPVKIEGAKSGEFKLNFEHDPSYADDVLFDNGYLYTGGEGNITVLDLTPEEQALILGNRKVKGGVVNNIGDFDHALNCTCAIVDCSSRLGLPKERMNKADPTKCYDVEVEEGFLAVREVKDKKELEIVVLKGKMSNPKEFSRPAPIQSDDLPF